MNAKKNDFDLNKLNKDRKLISDLLKPKKSSGKVLAAGWVNNTRQLGKIKFMILKDSSGMIQVTAVEGKVSKKVFDEIDSITRESVVCVTGSLVESKKAPGGKEIIPDEIFVLNKSEEPLIDVSDFSKTELPKRLDYRFLDLHRRKVQAVFKIKSEVARAFREFFYSKDFKEVFLPSVISSSSEGGTELFELSYFEKKAYLAQSPQLYKQMVAASPMEKIFTITPVWRAEKHNTVRHLNESRQMDIEVAFANQEEIMNYLGECVQYIIEEVIKKCKDDLENLEIKLKVPKIKYLSYEETVKLLKIKDGEDLSPEDERKLNEKFPDTIVFVHSWPSAIKPFYIMPKDENEKAKLSEGFDAIYKGIEISSGGQRIHIPELLEKMLKKKGLNPKHFKGYIDSFRFGAPPHAGWSIGLERLTMLLCNLGNIREAVLFPRDRDKLTP